MKNEPNIKDIEYTLNSLRDKGIFREQEQAALGAACQILAELRLNLGYNPRTTSIFDVIENISKLAS